MSIKDVLLTFADVAVTGLEMFDGSHLYRRDIQSYRKWREKNKIRNQDIYYLKENGLIELNKDGARLTPKAIERIKLYSLDNINIKIPDKWDGKWRLLCFDIPETKRRERDALNYRLNNKGFFCLARSIYCFPHPCEKEINRMANFYEITKFVTYIEASNITTSHDLIGAFKRNKILK